MLSDYKIVSHKFTGWESIPNVDHLRKIDNSYVDAFNGDVVFICYALNSNNEVVALGSGGYYENENYYEDEENNDDGCYGDERSRHLWIEGLVSTVKGLGRVILKELERRLINFGVKMHGKGRIQDYRTINVMSVEESVGFYENCGYSLCATSPRFAGTGNIRCAKAFNGENLDKQCLTKDDIFEDGWDLYRRLALGRRKKCEEYLNIPPEITYKDLVSIHIKDTELSYNAQEDKLQVSLYGNEVKPLKEQINKLDKALQEKEKEILNARLSYSEACKTLENMNK